MILYPPPPPTPQKRSDVVCVIGRRGSGKTTVVKNLLLPEYQPFIIYDSIGEYADVENTSLAESENDLFDLLEARSNIRVDPNSKISLDRICYVLNTAIWNYSLFVDEFHLVFEHHMTFAADNPEFKKLILLGRHRGHSVIISTQRPTDIPKYVLSQATVLYCFHVYHKQDVAFLANVINDSRITNTLDVYEFYEIRLDTPITMTRKKLKL